MVFLYVIAQLHRGIRAKCEGCQEGWGGQKDHLCAGYGAGLSLEDIEDYFAEFNESIIYTLPWSKMLDKFQKRYLNLCHPNNPQQWMDIGRLGSGIIVKTRKGKREFLKIMEILCLEDDMKHYILNCVFAITRDVTCAETNLFLNLVSNI